MISVVVPAFNMEKYLAETIESVMAQTVKNIEIVVVDDGSTDRTAEIARSFEHVKYLYQENGGLSKARNTGIIASKGKYIALVDSDDCWEPFKLEVQVSCLDKIQDAGLVFSDFSTFNSAGIINQAALRKLYRLFDEYNIDIPEIFDKKISLKDFCVSVQNSEIANADVYYGLVFETLLKGGMVLPSSALFRRECLSKVGLFNENYRSFEDIDFFLRFSQWYQLVYIDCSTVRYRIREGQITSKKDTMARQSIITTIDILCNITSKDPSEIPLHYDTTRRVLVKLYNQLAYYYITEYQPGLARSSIFKSIQYNKLQIDAYTVLLVSLLPVFFLKLFKSIKRYLKIQKEK